MAGEGFTSIWGHRYGRRLKSFWDKNFSLQLKKDDSEYGRDIPEELKELLELDDEGNRLFKEQLPSRQRNIIHYIAGAKSVQIRIDRAIMMIDRLKGRG